MRLPQVFLAYHLPDGIRKNPLRPRDLDLISKVESSSEPENGHFQDTLNNFHGSDASACPATLIVKKTIST